MILSIWFFIFGLMVGYFIGYRRKGKVLVDATEAQASIILGLIGERAFYVYKNGTRCYIGKIVGYSERGFVFELTTSKKRLEDKVLYADLHDKTIRLNQLQPKTND